MKTEFKDIAGNLAHGLKCVITKGQYSGSIEDVTLDNVERLCGEYNDSHKFILRPMSDLTKEITHRGYNDNKPFVPLVELAKICLAGKSNQDCDYVIKLHMEFVKIGEDNTPNGYINSYEFYLTKNNSFVLDCLVTEESAYIDQVVLFDMLDMLMFDYRDLIGVGAAISVNDLPENPYE